MSMPDDLIARGFLPYNAEAAELRSRYAMKPFAEKHKHFRAFFPKRPGAVLDVGAGIGVDARGFADLGHRVVAVEPADAMRAVAMEDRDHENITWIADYLPTLEKVVSLDQTFDFILLSASFMHLSPEYQQTGMTTLGRLTAPNGHVAMLLRHGPVPEGRTMYEISDETALSLGGAAGLAPVIQAHGADPRQRPGVTWSSFVFEKA